MVFLLLLLLLERQTFHPQLLIKDRKIMTKKLLFLKEKL